LFWAQAKIQQQFATQIAVSEYVAAGLAIWSRVDASYPQFYIQLVFKAPLCITLTISDQKIVSGSLFFQLFSTLKKKIFFIKSILCNFSMRTQNLTIFFEPQNMKKPPQKVAYLS
jgi:hypothetical protein